MQLKFLKRNVSGYVCNPTSSRERDAASRGHTSGIPASGCFIPEADAGSTARAFMLPGRLRHPPVTFHPSVGQITHVFRARSHWGRSQSISGRSVSFPRGTRVTYVTRDVIIAGPTDSRRCTFTRHYLQEATDPICFSTHVWCKPVLGMHDMKNLNRYR